MFYLIYKDIVYLDTMTLVYKPWALHYPEMISALIFELLKADNKYISFYDL